MAKPRRSSGSTSRRAGAGKGVLTKPDPATAGAKDQPAKETAGTQEKPNITVTLMQLGTGDSPIELAEGSTVADCLAAAGLSTKEGEVLVNSQHAKLSDKLEAGATVVFASKITGGCR